ncbi:unnamed protein product [Miscanthus lutarioriparius]|uniref:Uncharacterized protein n=1 Tax=Miscanthus lutarioriparius TaxID=422564 RepID=A0A811NG14_9POAL|nr:unnamed protein product [Miscanthus lutarioriparius]
MAAGHSTTTAEILIRRRTTSTVGGGRSAAVATCAQFVVDPAEKTWRPRGLRRGACEGDAAPRHWARTRHRGAARRGQRGQGRCP